MTWALHSHVADRKPPSPQLDLLRLFWRLQALSGKTLTCGLYQTAAGLEVRCDYGADDLIRSQFTPDIARANATAEAWKTRALSRAGFVELNTEAS